ncbi:MAG: beta-lactamase family protein, partial [bacterium]|nr:beta-lactamase family protein [bacterium]
MNNNLHANGRDIKNDLDRLIEKGKIPGVQYMVMKKNEILFEYNGGLQDIKNKIPVTASTTFMLNSSTKPITAAAILQLAEKGEIGLDSSVSAYYPGHPYGEGVTVRHLLNQTSGIPNPIPITWFHSMEEHENFDENIALAEVLKKSKLKFKPGEKYSYSNISYWLLGKIIEKVSRLSYPEYMKKNIFRPLSITAEEMDYTIPNLKLQAKEYQEKFSLLNLVVYLMDDKKLRGKSEGSWTRYKFIYHNGYAYGGLFTNARGLSRFLQDMLKERPSIFSPETKQAFFTRQKNNAGEWVETTLGWHIGELFGVKHFQKAGGGRGSSSNIRIYPDKGIATVFLVNKIEISEPPINKFSDSLDKAFIHPRPLR